MLIRGAGCSRVSIVVGLSASSSGVTATRHQVLSFTSASVRSVVIASLGDRHGPLLAVCLSLRLLVDCQNFKAQLPCRKHRFRSLAVDPAALYRRLDRMASQLRSGNDCEASMCPAFVRAAESDAGRCRARTRNAERCARPRGSRRMDCSRSVRRLELKRATLV